MSYSPFSQNSITSAGNSTTGALAAGATYTGSAEQNNYPDVMVSLKSDTSGTLYMDFSPDGTNWDSTLSFKYDPSRINPPHVLVKGSRHYRTRFTNTHTGAQTTFRLQTDYGSFQKLTAPVNGTLAETYDAISVRPTDYHYEVAMGKRQGRTTWNKFGYNQDVDAASEEAIWSYGGPFTPLTSGEYLEFSSTSSADTFTGSGAQQLYVQGVDDEWQTVLEILPISGTTPITTSNKYLGLNRVSIYLAGGAMKNMGDIGSSGAATTGVQSQMPAEGGTTQQCIFFVPENHTAMADWLYININKIVGGGGSPVVTVRGYVSSAVSNATYEVFRETIDTSVENTIQLNPSHPFVIGEKSSFYLTADTDTNNTVVNARISYLLERNS